VMKRETTKEVIEAIRRIREGKLYLSGPLSEAMTSQFVEGKKLSSQSPVEQLSDRELEVFQLLGSGYGPSQIADELHLSVKTVEGYKARIKEKLLLKDARELVQQAIQWNKLGGSTDSSQ